MALPDGSISRPVVHNIVSGGFDDPSDPGEQVSLKASALPIELCRLLCIGDSITEARATRPSGDGNHSWRYPFWKLMVDHQIGHQFVGTRTANNNGSSVYEDYLGVSFVNHHESIWGTNALERGNNAATWLGALKSLNQTPDVAVVFLGGNDMPLNLSLPAATVRDRIKVIVDHLQGDLGQAGNPGVRILLVSILPRFNGAEPDVRNARFGEINSLLESLAEEETTSASRVTFADAASAFSSSPELLYDGVHPNGAGENVLANTIFRALIPDRDRDGLPDIWEETYFEDHASSDGHIDSDEDGMSDLEEFLFGSNPMLRNARPGLVLDQNFHLIRFTLPAASGPGYEGRIRRYILQKSGNLVDWDDLVSGTAAGTEVTYPLNMDAFPCFYRLCVSVE